MPGGMEYGAGLRQRGQLGVDDLIVDPARARLPVRRGWRAQLGYIDAAHRMHAMVEDCIRTGKDCGIGGFPSHDFALNSAWLAAL